MTVLELLTSVYTAFSRIRQTGSTTMLVGLAEANRGIIVARDEKWAAKLRDLDSPLARRRVISMQYVAQYIEAIEPRPLFLDNGAVIYLCEQAIRVIEACQNQIKLLLEELESKDRTIHVLNTATQAMRLDLRETQQANALLANTHEAQDAEIKYLRRRLGKPKTIRVIRRR